MTLETSFGLGRVGLFSCSPALHRQCNSGGEFLASQRGDQLPCRAKEEVSLAPKLPPRSLRDRSWARGRRRGCGSQGCDLGTGKTCGTCSAKSVIFESPRHNHCCRARELPVDSLELSVYKEIVFYSCDNKLCLLDQLRSAPLTCSRSSTQ